MRLLGALAENYLGAIMPGVVRLTFHSDLVPQFEAKIIKGEEASPEWFPINLNNGNIFDINSGTHMVLRNPLNELFYVNANFDKNGREVATVTSGRRTLFYVRRKPYQGRFGGVPVSVELKPESEQT